MTFIYLFILYSRLCYELYLIVAIVTCGQEQLMNVSITIYCYCWLVLHSPYNLSINENKSKNIWQQCAAYVPWVLRAGKRGVFLSKGPWAAPQSRWPTCLLFPVGYCSWFPLQMLDLQGHRKDNYESMEAEICYSQQLFQQRLTHGHVDGNHQDQT